MSKPLVRTLLVDDDPDVLPFMKEILKGFTRSNPVLDWVPSGEEAVEQIGRVDYDVVLLDQRLGVKQGVEYLPDFKRLRPFLPVIILSGFSPKDPAYSHAGVSDFISKMDLTADNLEKTVLLALRPVSASTGNMEAFLTEYVRTTKDQTRELKRIGDGVEHLNQQIKEDMGALKLELETLQRESVERLDAMKASIVDTRHYIDEANKHPLLKALDWIKVNPRLALVLLSTLVFLALLIVVISQTLNVQAIQTLRGQGEVEVRDAY